MKRLELIEKDDTFYVDIRVTERCNNDCWYCSDLHNNAYIDKDLDIIGIAALIRRIPRDICVFIYGGEPTLHKDINALILVLSSISNVTEVILQTNFKIPLKIINTSKLIVNVSYHSNVPLKAFMTRLSKTKYLIGEIAIMEDIDTYNLFKEVYGSAVQYTPLINSSITESPTDPCVGKLEKPKGVEEDFHYRKQYVDDNKVQYSNYDMWSQNLNHFKGYQCSIKRDRIVIQDNLVHFCFNNIFISKERALALQEWEYSPMEVTCPFNTCFFEIGHTKYV
jgi:organic radical activating enzyme